MLYQENVSKHIEGFQYYDSILFIFWNPSGQ